MIITSKNIIEQLSNGEVISISPLYGSRKELYWTINKEIQVELSNGKVVTIPKGLKTDLCSVPKWLWSVCSPYGDFLFASLVHDYLYHTKEYPRRFADNEMLFWSNLINNKFSNIIRFKAVRLFGGLVWSGRIKL